MIKNQIKPLNLIGLFKEFADRVEKEVAAALMEDIGYGVIPEEFKGQTLIMRIECRRLDSIEACTQCIYTL